MMADPQKNGANGAMTDNKESSALFSLKELMTLEESRIKEEEATKKQRAEAEIQAKLDAERRERESQEAKLRDEEERRRQDELRRKMEDAQVEAAKAAEIEKRKLEDQHRLQQDAIESQRQHEKEIHKIQAQKRKGVHPGVLGVVGAAFVGGIVAVVYFASIKPAGEARDAVAKAGALVNSTEPSQWDEADKQIAIAKDKDPGNKDIPGVVERINKKREKLKNELAAKEAEREKEIRTLQSQVIAATKALESATTDAAKKEAQDQLDKLKLKLPGIRAGGPATAATTKPPCPPGVPLCN